MIIMYNRDKLEVGKKYVTDFSDYLDHLITIEKATEIHTFKDTKV